MDYPGGGGGGGGGGTFYPSGGQFALVQNVRGDILHGGTIRPPTTVYDLYDLQIGFEVS